MGCRERLRVARVRGAWHIRSSDLRVSLCGRFIDDKEPRATASPSEWASDPDRCPSCEQWMDRYEIEGLAS
jgi:hypothetical protein